jgi:hypothetical protein
MQELPVQNASQDIQIAIGWNGVVRQLNAAFQGSHRAISPVLIDHSTAQMHAERSEDGSGGKLAWPRKANVQ